jgi:hypothetical protein
MLECQAYLAYVYTVVSYCGITKLQIKLFQEEINNKW